jgi:hypothetical protein
MKTNKKFATPLAIEGTKEQLQALVPKLEELGYVKCVMWQWNYFDNCLVTNFGDSTGSLCSFDCTAGGHDRTIVSASNPELVLALAAMVEGEEFYRNEWVIPTKSKLDSYSGSYTFGKLYQLGGAYFKDYNPRFDTVSDDEGHQNGNDNFLFRKATKKEILNHFNKTTMKRITEYKLVKEYPNSLKLGSTIKPDVTAFTEICPKYPEFWEPVYEPEKPKIEIINLICSGGSFEIEVSAEGIYYRPENEWLDQRELIEAIKPKSVTVGGYTFTQHIEYIDSGCKHRVKISDWVRVLDAYKKFLSPFYGL